MMCCIQIYADYIQSYLHRMETESPSDIPVGQVEAVAAGRPAEKLGGNRAATVPSPAPGKTPVAPSLPITTPVSASAPITGSPGILKFAFSKIFPKKISQFIYLSINI
jgi:hypothetical protein